MSQKCEGGYCAAILCSQRVGGTGTICVSTILVMCEYYCTENVTKTRLAGCVRRKDGMTRSVVAVLVAARKSLLTFKSYPTYLKIQTISAFASMHHIATCHLELGMRN